MPELDDTFSYTPPEHWRYTSGKIVYSSGMEHTILRFDPDGHVMVECHCPRCEAAREAITQFVCKDWSGVDRAESRESVREYHIQEHITKRGVELMPDRVTLEACVVAEGWESPAVHWLERADGSEFLVLVMSRVRKTCEAERAEEHDAPNAG